MAIPGIWLGTNYGSKNLRPKNGEVMKFADSIKSKIIGIGNVGKNNSDLIIDVMLVEGLTHNLLSISFVTKATELCLNLLVVS